MKKLIADQFITDSVGFPPKGGTWKHLQEAHQETADWITNFLKIKNYNPFAIYILFGLEVAAVGGDVQISSGVVYYNHELFYVDGVTITPIVGQVPVLSIVESFVASAEADPVEFTDNVDHDVHMVRKMAITQAVSGSTIGDVYTSQRMLSPYVHNTTAANFNADKTIYFLGHENIKTTATNNTGGTILFNVSTVITQSIVVGAKVTMQVQFGGTASVSINATSGFKTILSQAPAGFVLGSPNTVNSKKLLFEFTLLTPTMIDVKVFEYTEI